MTEGRQRPGGWSIIASAARKAPVLRFVIHPGLPGRGIAEQLHPLVKKMRAHAQTPGHLPHRIPAHRDLVRCIALELDTVIACPHAGLLASKLGGKASKNPGAPRGRLREASKRAEGFLKQSVGSEAARGT